MRINQVLGHLLTQQSCAFLTSGAALLFLGVACADRPEPDPRTGRSTSAAGGAPGDIQMPGDIQCLNAHPGNVPVLPQLVID